MTLPLFLFIYLFFLLFVFHRLAKDDFVFLRKNVSLELGFNIVISASFIGLLFARIFFIAENPDMKYLNPLVFLLFPYFPGLSLSGGVIGSLLAIYCIAKYKKLPLGRLLDFYTLSFLFILPIGLFVHFFFTGKENIFGGVVLPLLFLGFFILFSTKLYPMLLRGVMKEGNMTLNFLMIFSLILLFNNFVAMDAQGGVGLGFEEYVLLGVFFVSLIIMVLQERGIFRVRRT